MTLTDTQIKHRTRVVRVNEIIVDVTRGHMTKATAEGLLIQAGLEPDAIKQLLDSASRNLKAVK